MSHRTIDAGPAVEAGAFDGCHARRGVAGLAYAGGGLIIKKRPRGDYEIGIFTEDGAIVARVSIWERRTPAPRTDEEKEEAALEKVKRLVKALDETLAGASRPSA